MIINLILILILLSLIFFCLSRLRKIYLRDKNERKADKVLNIENFFYDLLSKGVAEGNEQFKLGRAGKPLSLGNIGIGLLWNFGGAIFEKMNPRQRCQAELKKLTEEAMEALNAARNNAEAKGSKQALAHIADCVMAIKELYETGSVSSYGKTHQMIEKIIEQAKEIANASTFADAGSAAGTGGEASGKRNYYEILGVPRDADAEEIKKQFRKLAAIYHPDKYEHLAPDLKALAADRFREINEANDVLSNEEKRKAYDETI